jgi:hypothetical protein
VRSHQAERTSHGQGQHIHRRAHRLWKSIEIYADGLAEIDQYGPNSQLVFYGLMIKRAAL